ncbi:DVUA0089 family protein [Nitrosospira sp. NRS527]|uniref:DVUA0089 family protein n=1 Tax=Nitrosospira sp. NRS527 TaxID=155925 RepID=UPI001BCC620D|nr:DVUA0089 family protein [Nitrosospira sp. NRS527]
MTYYFNEDMMRLISVCGKFCKTLVLAGVLMAAHPVYASVYHEVDDAGTTPGTAAYISWDTTTIFGAIHDDDGADVYGFEWGGGFFFADTFGSDFDTMLSLFNEAGKLLAFNDDFDQPLFSQLSLELDPGNYFLGITYYDNNYGGNMRYYVEEGIEGSYQIQKSISQLMPAPLLIVGEDVANVPEPATLALVAIGVLGVLLNRRRKHAL